MFEVARWLAVVSVAAMAGCAHLERNRLADEAAALQSPVLRRVATPSELDDIVRRAEAFATRLEEVRIREACRNPEVGDRPASCRPRRGVPADHYVAGDELDSIHVTGSRLRLSDIITNNQEAGVDEGDIVKKSGEFLLVMRGNHLHAVRIASGAAPVLASASRIALPSGADEDVWYDELLVAGPRVIVLGYNYDEDVAELSLFRLGADGTLTRGGRYWLRGSDYYSGSDYATRLLGDQLLFTLSVPLELQAGMAWPEWSRRDVPAPVWKPLVDTSDLWYPVAPGTDPAVHLIVRCTLDALDRAGELGCDGTGLVGPDESTLYVSATHAYVALASWDPAAYRTPSFDPADHSGAGRLLRAAARRTTVFRLPLAGGAQPAFATVTGELYEASQFDEAVDGGLFVLPRQDLADDHDRWLLHRIRPGDFTQAMAAPVPPIAPPVEGAFGAIRFGSSAVWLGQAGRKDDTVPPVLVAQPLDGSGAVRLSLAHWPETLQPAFGGMLAIGASLDEDDESTVLTWVRDDAPYRVVSVLDTRWPPPAESRSHAVNPGTVAGTVRLVGFPVQPEGDPDPDTPADLGYVRILDGGLSTAGRLAMGWPGSNPPCDECWDWYGSARTFFVGDRIFGLSADRLLEGRWDGGSLAGTRKLELP